LEELGFDARTIQVRHASNVFVMVVSRVIGWPLFASFLDLLAMFVLARAKSHASQVTTVWAWQCLLNLPVCVQHISCSMAAKLFRDSCLLVGVGADNTANLLYKQVRDL